jgi:hypothetical protein
LLEQVFKFQAVLSLAWDALKKLKDIPVAQSPD